MPEFYWLNGVNMVEVGGPFETIELAKSNAVVEYTTKIGDIAHSILILQKVGEGKITAKVDWVDGNPVIDASTQKWEDGK